MKPTVGRIVQVFRRGDARPRVAVITEIPDGENPILVTNPSGERVPAIGVAILPRPPFAMIQTMWLPYEADAIDANDAYWRWPPREES